MKLRSILGACAAGILLLAGCSGDEIDPATEISLPEVPEGQDGNKGVLSFDHEVAGGLMLKTSYSTHYPVKAWKITDSKTLDFKLEVTAGDGRIIMVENVHADVSLQSTRQGFDGILQDTMDDRLHTGTQIGFLVTPNHPYTEVFSVEGYSQFLISGWGFAISGTGASSINYDRLNEKGLKEAGVYGNKFIFVYDVVIQDPETGLFYKEVLRDEFLYRMTFSEQKTDVEEEDFEEENFEEE